MRILLYKTHNQHSGKTSAHISMVIYLESVDCFSKETFTRENMDRLFPKQEGRPGQVSLPPSLLAMMMWTKSYYSGGMRSNRLPPPGGRNPRRAGSPIPSMVQLLTSQFLPFTPTLTSSGQMFLTAFYPRHTTASSCRKRAASEQTAQEQLHDLGLDRPPSGGSFTFAGVELSF